MNLNSYSGFFMELDWVKDTPKQGRSQRTLEQLLDATEQLLASRRFADLSIKDITTAAGCSVGTFYTRFETKDDVLRALYSRYADASRRTLAVWSDPASWEGVPLEAIVTGLVRFIVADYRARTGVRRAFDEAMLRDDRLFAMMENLTEDTIDGLARLLDARPDEHRVGPGAPAAAFVHRLVFGALDQDVRFDTFPGGWDLDEEAMTAQLSRAVCAWLR